MANPLSTFCVSLLLFIVLLVQRSSAGADYRYESCVQKQCDKGLGIKFPFYITGEQEPFCGLFAVFCCSNGGYPKIRLSDNDYVITEISYEKRSFWVYNAAVQSMAGSCLLEFRNVTTPQPSMSIVSSSSLHLLSRCVRELPEQLDKYKVACNNDTADGWELAILGDDENLSSGIRQCSVDVVAPVELRPDEGRNGSVVDFKGLLRNGFALNWTSRDCTGCEQSGGHCGIEPQTNGFRCYCSYGFEYTICKSRKKSTKTIGILVIAAGGVVVVSLVILALCFITRKRFSWWSYCCMHNKLEDQQIENFLKNNNYGSLAPKRYRYSDLNKITNSFDTKLGEGGYGSVYKGKLQDGRLVAVKVLKETKGNNNGEDFINEVESISRTSHVNIVTLLGFCFQVHNNKKALIYEFMTNGSLEKFIHGDNNYQGENNRQLGWPTLYRIAVGIARGLEYLHRGCNTRILHFDIKPQNILLDEDFCPKISDFGLAKLCPRRKDSIISEMDIARGTIGFIAPEMVYKNIGGVSHKSDVYSYGMMVLEMVGGRKNADSSVDRASQKYFPHWIYTRLIMNQCRDDHNDQEELCLLSGIKNEEENKQVKKMLMVSFWCIQTNPSSRPTIANVLEMLEGPLENIQIPPKPFLYSPSRTSSSSSSSEEEEEDSSPPDYLSFLGCELVT